jgi:hypothetical protein
MKSTIPLYLFFLFFANISLDIHAQLDQTKGTDEKGEKKAIFTTKAKSTEQPTSITVDPSNGFKEAFNHKKKTQKEMDDELNNKGIISQAKLNEELALKSFSKINGQYQFPKIDQDLGTFRTNSNSVKIICRDFQYPDGDRVTIYVNDIPAVQNIVLKQSYQAFTIPLDIGINQISFVALNQGSSGPNTAGFKVYDDSGSLLSANEWNLATGAKATLLIAKDQ